MIQRTARSPGGASSHSLWKTVTTFLNTRAMKVTTAWSVRFVVNESSKLKQIEMKRTDRWVAALVTAAVCLGFVADSRAELINRGTYDGVNLIYDSVQRLTWLGDANWAQTSGFDPDGEMTWAEARTWAGRLTIGGLSDWRLPITSDETCRGAGCTNSEMGHLFDVEGVSSTNPGPFLNLQERQYWSSRSDSSEPDLGWYVHFGNGDQGVTGKSDSHMPWAVRDGDVGAEVSIENKPDSFLVRMNLGLDGARPVTVLGSVLPHRAYVLAPRRCIWARWPNRTHRDALRI